MKDREIAIRLLRGNCREYRRKLEKSNDDYAEGLDAGFLMGIISTLENFNIWSLWGIKRVLSSVLLEKMRKAHAKKRAKYEQIHQD